MFNQKEEGYDEFVAECVRKGLEDVEQGRTYTFAQSKAMARAVLARIVSSMKSWVTMW